jgi:hypothetical protein
VIVQVLCSYSTLPLYALVSQVRYTCFLVSVIDKLHLKSDILYSFLPTFFFFFFFFFFFKIFALKMGSSFKQGIFKDGVESAVRLWAEPIIKERDGSQTQMDKMVRESPQSAQISEQAMVVIEETTISVAPDLPCVAQRPFPLS